MKILRIIISLDPKGGGPPEGIRRLTEALARAGHVQHVVTMDGPDADFLTDFPGTVHALGSQSRDLPQGAGALWKRFGFTPGAIKWVRQHRDEYDAVIVSGLWNYGAVVGRFGLQGYRKPVLVFVHGMLAPWLKEFNSPRKHLFKQMSWLINEGVLLNKADRVLFTSEEEMISARDSFVPYRLKEEVVSYGTGDAPVASQALIQAFKAACPSIGQRKYFLFLSRIYPKKGCDLLIRAFARHASNIPEIDLVIAGPDQIGWGGELKNLSEELGVAGRIHWPGLLTGDAKWGAYHGAEAFVLPSHHENFGIVVAEAMACGKPLLISDKINIWRETMEDGASIVETNDQAGTNRMFERYLALPESHRISMGESSRESFLKRFHIDSVASDLIRLIEKVAAEKCRSTSPGTQ